MKNIKNGLLDLTMRDNTPLSFNYCETEKTNFILLFVPSFGGEYNQYKRLFYGFLQSNDAAVFCMAIRGQSKKKDNFFHVDNTNQFLSDIEDLFSHIRTMYSDIPVYVCAHSGGSSLATKFVTNQAKSIIKGLFLIEPVFAGDMEIDRTPIPWAYKLTHFVYQMKLPALPSKPIIPVKWDYYFSVIKFLASNLFGKLVVLKVRENNESPWKYYTGAYLRSYSFSYNPQELKKTLRKIKCPMWVILGENDEYTSSEAITSILNWNVSPESLRELYLAKGTTHFGSLSISASLITRWLRQENSAKKNINPKESISPKKSDSQKVAI